MEDTTWHTPITTPIAVCPAEGDAAMYPLLEARALHVSAKQPSVDNFKTILEKSESMVQWSTLLQPSLQIATLQVEDSAGSISGCNHIEGTHAELNQAHVKGASPDGDMAVGSPASSCRRSSSSPTSENSTPTTVNNFAVANLLSEVEKKKRRLQRKSELAKKNRELVKTRTKELEFEVAHLKAKIFDLKQKTSQRSSDEPSKKRQRVSSTELYPRMLKLMVQVIQASRDDCSEEQLTQLVSDFVFTHTAWLKEGRRCLESVQPALRGDGAGDFTNWFLSQPDTFYQQPGNLWSNLWNEQLNLDGEQLRKLEQLQASVCNEKERVDPATLIQTHKHLASSYDQYAKSQSATVKDLLRIVNDNKSIAKCFDWLNMHALLLKAGEKVVGG